MNNIYNHSYLFNPQAQDYFIANSFNPHDYGFINQVNSLDNSAVLYSLNYGFSNIAKAIESSGNGSLSDGIWLALIGALSAALFNFVQKKFDDKAVKLSKSGEATLSLIKELEGLSIDYWIKGYVPAEKDKLLLSEVTIKAILITLRANILTLIENLPIKDKEANKLKLLAFSSEVYDLTTGGSFESTARTPSKRSAFAVARKCSDAKAMILKLI
ncbi:hypothetical protein [Enterobacter huaxiensis]|uniref:hypothetical protein n=1 Tax=Enterobacter huaxiensis TaxID=2494702 RepID=UPI0028BEE153|nr:hypothetical protein [Enterobacter huaxiensis]